MHDERLVPDCARFLTLEQIVLQREQGGTGALTSVVGEPTGDSAGAAAPASSESKEAAGGGVCACVFVCCVSVTQKHMFVDVWMWWMLMFVC